MKTIVIYESMYSNTHLVAEAIAAGLSAIGEVQVLPVSHASAGLRHGFTLIADPESFLVTKDNHLEPDEQTHARTWGSQLASAIASASQPSELG